MRALLIIDIQNGLTNRKDLYNKTLFIESVNLAIGKYRILGNIVIFVQHNNKQLLNGTNDWKIDMAIKKTSKDIVLQKQHGNAFVKTELKSILENRQIKEILICGLVTHGCVKSTCIGAVNQGLTTSLLKNGHTNWNKDAELKISLTESELRQLGVKVINRHEL